MQQTCIYRDHKKFPNTENTKNFSNIYHANFPMAETTKFSITRKPYNKFLHIENFQFIPPFRCYTQQKQQKTHIVPNQKSRTQPKKKKKSHSAVIPIQMFFLILPKTT